MRVGLRRGKRERAESGGKNRRQGKSFKREEAKRRCIDERREGMRWLDIKEGGRASGIDVFLGKGATEYKPHILPPPSSCQPILLLSSLFNVAFIIYIFQVSFKQRSRLAQPQAVEGSIHWESTCVSLMDWQAPNKQINLKITPTNNWFEMTLIWK